MTRLGLGGQVLIMLGLVLGMGVIVFAQDRDTGSEKKLIMEKTEEVTVTGAPVLKEEQPVGAYQQPEWTTVRRFPTTRVYLQVPPESAELEQWVIVRNKKHSEPTETRFRNELALGLGHRLQLDFYFDTVNTASTHTTPGTNEIRDTSIEIRYALADWGKIFGNPTLYFEYLWRTTPVIEPKLLLGGDICSGLHWGLNLIYEGEINIAHEDKDDEWSATAGISKTIIDQHLSLGIEVRYVYETARDAGLPTEYSNELYVGPSLQYLFHKKAMVDLVPMWGVTSDSRIMDLWLVFRWEF